MTVVLILFWAQTQIWVSWIYHLMLTRSVVSTVSQPFIFKLKSLQKTFNFFLLFIFSHKKLYILVKSLHLKIKKGHVPHHVILIRQTLVNWEIELLMYISICSGSILSKSKCRISCFCNLRLSKSSRAVWFDLNLKQIKYNKLIV